MNVALYEIEGSGSGVERLEGEREVCVANVAQKLVSRFGSFYLGIVVLIEFDTIGCRQLIFLTISLKIGVFGNAEPIILMAITAETDSSASGIGINFLDNQREVGAVVLLRPLKASAIPMNHPGP